MTGSADERSRVDRAEEAEDPDQDLREEYTSYRQEKPDQPARDPEAIREAELQPGSDEGGEQPGANDQAPESHSDEGETRADGSS